MSDVMVYALQTTPRLEYTLEVVLGRLLGLSFHITHDPEAWQQYSGAKICYGNVPVVSPACVHIPACGLLQASGIQAQYPKGHWQEETPGLFAAGNSRDWQDDCLATAFYLLSRYEEYLPFEPDRHWRFPAKAAIAVQEKIVHLPVVQLIADRLGRQLQSLHSGLVVRRPAFQYLPTYDIDLAWAYRYRPWWRQTGGFINDIRLGRFQMLRERMAVLSGHQGDPFDTYQWLEDLHRQTGLPARFFFLLGDYSRYDQNHPHHLPAMQHLIKSIAGQHPVGIHPSYASNDHPGQLEKEIKRLENIIDQPVRDSRQHFLRLRFPSTYRQLPAAGIQRDYSMGFSEITGFRAGIAVPFPWYDLPAEKQTDLEIHPFQIMDVTLQEYLKYEPDRALAEMNQLATTLRQTGGNLVTLWHNSSVTTQPAQLPWRNMYRQWLLEQASK